ncbi:MAG TPA: NrtA/SsuA/CpmA family ABC transporter substrate-binding protein [Nitrospiraceae bacterium]|nr:NrtA/SsuA/CpmA family ABC transporter substrate-binding protein [Nitrospiraceae bacterium]
MRRSTVLVVIGMAFVLSVGSGSAAPQAVAEALLPLKIGYQSSSADDWLLFAARDLKLFERVGVAPEYTQFVAGPPMIEAAKSNRIDVAIVKTIPFLIGLSQGVDWVMIGIYSEGAYSEGLVVGKDSGIETPGDLKGKRIGYFKGSSAHYGVIMTLRQHGIPRDQVTLLDMPPEEQLAALMNKDLDAAMVWEPWIQKMVHEANARLIATEGDLGINTNVASISVRREWLRDNRETAVRFLRALVMAYDALQKDHNVAIRAVAEETGTKKEWVEQIYRDAPPPHIHLWADSRYLYSLAKGAVFHRRLGYVARFMLDEKVFPKEVDIGDILDASVITEALSTPKRAQ